MGEIVIKAENLSKQYQLGQVGTGTLRRDLQRWYSRIRGKEDPTLKIGQENILSASGIRRKAPEEEFVWALRDINFEVRQGEVLGIIGKNGAGKSTLLKILSQVTLPTTGEVKVRGRIASLLEVGTGFHPELTGKENIFLNGAILGMTKSEIRNKFDEIVDFSGIENYIDTPVKRYSSGMYVRLAFAVAAHLEPEILVVDEVLAVGDAEFQKKAIGKMQDVSQSKGRTVLFVSHNMSALSALCPNGLLLKNGGIDYYGEMSQVINRYINTDQRILNGVISKDTPRYWGQKGVEFKKVILTDLNNNVREFLYYHEPFRVIVKLEVYEEIKETMFQLGLINSDGVRIINVNTWEKLIKLDFPKGSHEVEISIAPLLYPGFYSFYICLCTIDAIFPYDSVEQILNIEVLSINKEKNLKYPWAKPVAINGCYSEWKFSNEIKSQIVEE